MSKITALTDYKNRFGSKYFDSPYRSGMNKELLIKSFAAYGYELEFMKLADAIPQSERIHNDVIYTSQEDFGYRYKSFIEDVVLGLEESGKRVLPGYKFLRANNNKVFMEILRKQALPNDFRNNSKIFGCLEELKSALPDIKYPAVIKTAEGAGSHGVFKADTTDELIRICKRISRTRYFKDELRDLARAKRHEGYQRESLYRNKFIVQDFIPGLENDWKVLVFYDKYYVLRRKNRPGDFRASGSGLFTFDQDVDPDLLNTANHICKSFNIPMISLDLARSGDMIHLIEMQFVYFGTTTLEKSPYYYTLKSDLWEQVHTKSVIEIEYATSISNYLDNRC